MTRCVSIAGGRERQDPPAAARVHGRAVRRGCLHGRHGGPSLLREVPLHHGVQGRREQVTRSALNLSSKTAPTAVYDGFMIMNKS